MKLTLPSDPAIEHMSIYSTDSPSYQTHDYSSMFISIYSQYSEIGNSLDVYQLMKEIMKMCYIHIMEYYFDLKKNEICAGKCIELYWSILLVAIKTQKHKHCAFLFLICKCSHLYWGWFFCVNLIQAVDLLEDNASPAEIPHWDPTERLLLI